MAKTTDRDLFETLRARGLRKSAASNLAKAFGRADNSPPSNAAKRAVSELRDLVSDLEGRVGGGSSKSSKRSAAAKKAAATRKRKANERSRAAKKAAQTRAKSSSSRSTSSRGKSTRAKAKSR